MKSAKIIAFIAFICNSFLLVNSLIIHFKMLPAFKDLQIATPFPLPSLFTAFFAVASVAYWLYIKNKEKKGENVKFALAISVVLFVIPILLIAQIFVSTYMLPIYDILGTF